MPDGRLGSSPSQLEIVGADPQPQKRLCRGDVARFARFGPPEPPLATVGNASLRSLVLGGSSCPPEPPLATVGNASLRSLVLGGSSCPPEPPLATVGNASLRSPAAGERSVSNRPVS